MIYLLAASAIIIYIMAVGWAADRRRADYAESAFHRSEAINAALVRKVKFYEDRICQCGREALMLDSRDGMTPEERVQVGIDMQRVICELQRREVR